MGRKIGIALATVAAIVLLVWGIPYLQNAADMLFPCTNTVITSAVSPGGRFKAVLFNRECGATTGFSSQVSIIPAGFEPPNDSGNVFVADLPDNKNPAPWGGPRVTIRWQSTEHLVVKYDRSARISRNEKRVGDVAVTYEAD